MPKYRKKPVIVEAKQFNLDRYPSPDGVCYCAAGIMPIDSVRSSTRPHVHTLEGVHIVSTGDYIITGVKGEKYPCKPDIFEMTYEPVIESEPETALDQLAQELDVRPIAANSRTDIVIQSSSGYVYNVIELFLAQTRLIKKLIANS